MRRHFFTVGQTYSEITPESAEHGDFSDTGWEREKTNDWTIEDILRALRDQGCEEISSHGSELTIYGWYSTECYKTGTEKQLCLHVSGAPKNIARLMKILKLKKAV